MEGRVCHLKTIRVNGGKIIQTTKHGYDLHCISTYCDIYGICPWSDKLHKKWVMDNGR